MNYFHKRRMYFVILIFLCVASAVALALYALQQNINLFFSPSQIMQGMAPENHEFRLGGIVAEGSVQRIPNSLSVNFIVTDNHEQIRVAYNGMLPDLFRAGQSVVVEGKLDGQGHMIADQVLAKHDERYMPAQVAALLSKDNHDT